MEQRRDRLWSEHRSLVALSQASSILTFECEGEPPDCYTVEFRGQGLALSPDPGREFEPVGRHAIEIRLRQAFPAVPPDVRWTTPLFHPNVAFGGLVDWPSLGLNWRPDSGLDILCERLWDVARFAHLDLDFPRNAAAARWFGCHPAFRLPFDSRPLRNLNSPSRRSRNPTAGRTRGSPTGEFARGAKTLVASSPEDQLGSANRLQDILVITEETPIPHLPNRIVSPPLRLMDNQIDNDLFYIGD